MSRDEIMFASMIAFVIASGAAGMVAVSFIGPRNWTRPDPPPWPTGPLASQCAKQIAAMQTRMQTKMTDGMKAECDAHSAREAELEISARRLRRQRVRQAIGA